MSVLESRFDVVVVGAGACGVIAAMAAAEQGAQVLVLERDALPRGSTALSSGLIPAAGTRAQLRQGIDNDSPARLAADIQAKAKGRADTELTELFARESAPVIDWLEVKHHIPFEVLEGFLYPGHGAARMHAVPERTGEALIDRLWRAAERLPITLLTQARVTDLLSEQAGRLAGRPADRKTDRITDRMTGVAYQRPDGVSETVAAAAIVLACNGFGGNPRLVAELIPEMRDALYFGHTGNQGEAILWGRALGLELADTGAYQGHGSVAHPHGVLITWAIIMEGGVQINARGARFWDESQGYSEAALAVLAQDGGAAWNIFDQRLHDMALQFPDYERAQRAGAIRGADSIDALAAEIGVDRSRLERELDEHEACCQSDRADRFGRRFDARHRLQPPYYAVRVTGALFHTQGGLAVDTHMRVKTLAGGVIDNLFAAGGAARGVSGDSVWGYLSGNGLLAAVAGGFRAGREASLRR